MCADVWAACLSCVARQVFRSVYRRALQGELEQRYTTTHHTGLMIWYGWLLSGSQEVSVISVEMDEWPQQPNCGSQSRVCMPF